MSALAVVSLEGVLARPSPHGGDSFAAAQPHKDGIKIYAALLTTHRVFLSSLQPREMTLHWLQTQGIRRYSGIMADVPRPGVEDWHVRAEHLLTIQREHGAIDLWVETDPVTASRMLREGVTSLLLSRPAYIRGEYRPDQVRSLKSWESLEQEVSEQMAMQAEDERLKTEADVRFEA